MDKIPLWTRNSWVCTQTIALHPSSTWLTNNFSRARLPLTINIHWTGYSRLLNMTCITKRASITQTFQLESAKYIITPEPKSWKQICKCFYSNTFFSSSSWEMITGGLLIAGLGSFWHHWNIFKKQILKGISGEKKVRRLPDISRSWVSEMKTAGRQERLFCATWSSVTESDCCNCGIWGNQYSTRSSEICSGSLLMFKSCHYKMLFIKI